MSKKDFDEVELEWIRFRQDTLGEHAFGEETAGGKFNRKFKQNPFVPIGAVATIGALTYGLWCFQKGRGKHSQYMMRARIAAQGFTVMALVGGIFMSAMKENDQKARALQQAGSSSSSNP